MRHLQVPLDYRRPGGRQITVAVSRIPAADPATRRGVLLLNPGGPGGEGLDTPSEAGPAGEPLLAAYDLIGCDPRGVGHSTPVTCGLTEAQLTPPLPYPAPDGSIAANVAFARSAAAACAARSGDLLPYITTANTARDMDRIRQALGTSRLSYYGDSYGTSVTRTPRSRRVRACTKPSAGGRRWSPWTRAATASTAIPARTPAAPRPGKPSWSTARCQPATSSAQPPDPEPYGSQPSRRAVTTDSVRPWVPSLRIALRR